MMKVLMLGWEFPPHISGGLGTACLGLTKGLAKIGEIDLTFVVPKKYGDEDIPNITFVGADQIPVIQEQIKFDDLTAKLNYYALHSHLVPYLGTAEFEKLSSEKENQKNRFIELTEEGRVLFNGGYGFSLLQEIEYYSVVAEKLATELDFDVIHVHDWMCFPAGIAAKRMSGKPLIAHIHSTEFDRSGQTVNPLICSIEKEGMQAADRVVAVSEYTKLLAMRNYGISSRKITVIHNAVDVDISVEQEPMPIYSTDKVVTFMGRVTTQKGPQYFVDAAVLVSKKIKNVRFVMAGKGDLLEEMKHRVEILGVSGYFSFPGFVPDEKIGELFQETDVFVMPSVSEPFGIVALEAMQAGLPVVITRQSGVSEVVKNALKVDYWDTEAMAEAICSVLTNEKLKEKLSVKGEKETQKLVWAASALKLHKLYKSLLK